MTGETTTNLLIVLGFLLLVIVVLIAYFYRLQARYFALTEASIGRVDEIRVVESAIFTQLAKDGGSADAASAAAPEPLRIEGDKVIAVGAGSPAFRVLDELSEDAVVSWAVEPVNSATKVVSPDTRSLVVYPAVPGPLTITAATTVGGSRYEGRFETVAAVATRSKALELPWPGRGLGTLIVSIVVLGVALLLALEGLIAGAALAALLTAVAGFAFGVRALESK